MKSFKRIASDLIGIILISVSVLIYLNGGPDGNASSEIPQKPKEYQADGNSVFELNSRASFDKIAALFPRKKSVVHVHRTEPKPQTGQKPVNSSSYLSYVSSSVNENGQKVYVFVDNTIMRIYTLALGESSGGLTLKEVRSDYFLIETSDSFEKIPMPK